MAKRKNSSSNDPPLLTPLETAEIDAAVDAALKEVMGDRYDPNWRTRPPSPPLDLPDDRAMIEHHRRTTVPFFATAFRLQKTAAKTKHRMGGSRLAPKPVCAICKTNLVLFADLNARDPLLRGDHPLKRLPFYYCGSCPGPVHYQVLPNGRVTVLPSRPQPYDACPFTVSPVVPNGYLRLKKISPKLDDALVTAHLENGFATLSEAERNAIARLFGRKPAGRWDTYFSQIGGWPFSYQGGDEGRPDCCPNRSCAYRRRKGQEFRFRPLAVLDLWHDRFWENRSDALQIVYHVCPGCFTVAAKYSCT